MKIDILEKYIGAKLISVFLEFFLIFFNKLTKYIGSVIIYLKRDVLFFRSENLA